MSETTIIPDELVEGLARFIRDFAEKTGLGLTGRLVEVITDAVVDLAKMANEVRHA